MFRELLVLAGVSLVVTEMCVVKMLHEYSADGGSLREALFWAVPTVFSGAMLLRFVDALLHG
uniref:Uncharacterized protein n=1 Tax=viral metagenome TaxID=1070528 RepID=A0A6M3K9G5_9ZZZZ